MGRRLQMPKFPMKNCCFIVLARCCHRLSFSLSHKIALNEDIALDQQQQINWAKQKQARLRNKADKSV